eukprot:CAMPEP_0116151564 /NCGR_PEP_ID=MMETSP0329-20121206/20166_1 /TAXON_ID=697910 /ORGANISM="Pseudo-nitzschia arenysensis, Strain B593" /LENGTH=529 /DNA_ID=CAMNT_0003648189 /DNA_START=270 /DNA_END=1859 /DNA_ORIENTATION=+
MYQRSVKDRNGSSENLSPTAQSSPTFKSKNRKQQQQHQQKMGLIRSNASKNYFSKVRLPILLLMALFVTWGFVGTWMVLEVQTIIHMEGGDSSRQLGLLDKTLRNRLLPNTIPRLRNRKQYEKLKANEQKVFHSMSHPSISDEAPTFQQFSEQAPECYELESPDEITMTLVTQVSHDRLWMLKHHCDRYRNQEGGIHDQHPMSIAVYSNSTLDEILDEMREMNCGVASKDNPEAPVVVSVLDAQTHGAWNEFPVNELRNLALSRVTTTHILYIDVDFWPSEDLYETIMLDDPESADEDDEKSIRQELVDDPKLALVIPAFQLWRQCREWEDCREDNLPHMENARTLHGMAHEIVEKKSITIFDPTNKGGHGSTDYEAWFHQAPGSLHDIDCLQSNRYEPFVMVRYCRDLPPFQTAFSGYGKNKVTWMMQVIASGYIFSQVGGVYLVHYPHLDSASRQLWNGPKTTPSPTSKKLQTKRGKIDKLFVDFKAWLDESIVSQNLQRLEACEDAQDDDGKLWVETKANKPQEKE